MHTGSDLFCNLALDSNGSNFCLSPSRYCHNISGRYLTGDLNNSVGLARCFALRFTPTSTTHINNPHRPAQPTQPAQPKMYECQSQEQSRCDLRHPENLHPTVSLKRKASTDLSGFSPTKPDPRPSPQPSAAPNKPQPFLLASTSTVHAIAPELASINAILRQHCRARLCVRPLAWTMAQPRLLGCRFVFKDLPRAGRRTRECGERDPSGCHRPSPRAHSSGSLPPRRRCYSKKVPCLEPPPRDI